MLQGCISEYALDEFKNSENTFSVSGLPRPGVPAEIFVGRIGSLGNVPRIENPSGFKVTISWIQNGEELMDSLHFETDRLWELSIWIIQ